MRGCSVLTRPPSISGAPVTDSTDVTSSPSSSSRAAVPPEATSSQPSVGEAARELVEAGLVVDGDQRAHSRLTTARQQLVLDGVDPLLERLARLDGDRPLLEHRPGVEPRVDDVNGDAGHRRRPPRARPGSRARRGTPAAATGGR